MQLILSGVEVILASGVSEIGNGCKFVPLDCLLAEVKVFQSERDATQEVVLTQRLGAEHTQLQLP